MQVARALLDDQDALRAALPRADTACLNASALAADPMSLCPQALLALLRYRQVRTDGFLLTNLKKHPNVLRFAMYSHAAVRTSAAGAAALPTGALKRVFCP